MTAETRYITFGFNKVSALLKLAALTTWPSPNQTAPQAAWLALTVAAIPPAHLRVWWNYKFFKLHAAASRYKSKTCPPKHSKKKKKKEMWQPQAITEFIT